MYFFCNFFPREASYCKDEEEKAIIIENCLDELNNHSSLWFVSETRLVLPAVRVSLFKQLFKVTVKNGCQECPS